MKISQLCILFLNPASSSKGDGLRLLHMTPYLESQQSVFRGYFEPIMGYFGVWWSVILGYLPFQVKLKQLKPSL